MTRGPRSDGPPRVAPEAAGGPTEVAAAADLRAVHGPAVVAEPGATPGAPEGKVGTFYALRFRNFRLLWLGNAFTSAAMWIQQTTLGWVVYDITGSGSILGAVNGVRGIPVLMVSPISGVISDRVSRGTIIAVSQVGLFAITFLLAVGLAFDRVAIWHLFAFAILGAIGNTFNMPARQTLVFDVVPRHVVPNAVALGNIAFSMARTAGPVAGGALIVAFGAANNFLIQSLAYVGVLITVLMIRLPRSAQRPAKRPFLKDLAEGYGYAIRTPRTRLLLLMMIINPLFLIPLHLALLPIFTKDVFGMDASGLGILLASIGAGGFMGGLLTASLHRVDRWGIAQLSALFVYSLAQVAFSVMAWLTGELWFSVGFLVLAGAAEAMYMTANQTVLQLVVPDHLRGRITAMFQIQPVLMSVGLVLAGMAADGFGAPAVGTVLSLMAFGLGVMVLVFSPTMRGLRLSRLTQAAGAA